MTGNNPLPGPQNQRLQMYANLMGELKERCEFIVRTSKDSGGDVFRYEVCQLQVRKICEIVALACLCVHDEVEELRTKTAQKEWNPERIMRRMEALNPKFFPEPIHAEEAAEGKTTVYRLRDNYINKDELLQYWFRSGENLHRGDLHRLSTRFHPIIDFDYVVDFVDKLKNFLSPYHRISLRDDESLGVLCKMHDPAHGHRVHVDIIELPKT